ncbi:methylenetetrahydrofolate reductase [Neorhizobium sp. NCHU2750]|uniref:methylenetetrahydrofolate reductase n=1 Tax=Neorhizobium sp. NCHU2750 TaxID=1825976 RepID=UPI000EB71D77|nr:methylenetetrahydrofolate reductase [Neorhizobium sp. NCHU2750]
MAILSIFRNRQAEVAPQASVFGGLLGGYSIEVMPRTAAKIDSFREFLPAGTRVYIAHIDGTPIEDMVATAKRLTDEGYVAMPHIPARSIHGKAMLEDWIARYVNEAGVEQALLLAGGVASPAGDLASSLHLLETGLFDRYGFKRLHVAGHPEGNKDIDRDGTTLLVDEALKFKQAWSERSNADMAIVTQFAFDAKPVILWAERIAAAGVKLPIHLGVTGPTKLQTLIKFAVSCGVGPSLGVLQKRALDLSKLLTPYEPEEFLTEIAAYKLAHPESLIEQIHVFPLGGIRPSADWMNQRLLEDRIAAR